jgi:hypothetical protein
MMSRFQKFGKIAVVIAVCVGLVSCGDDGGTGPSTPASLDTSDYTAAALTQRATVSMLDAHVATIKQANTPGTPLNGTQLQAYWSATSTLQQRTIPPFVPFIDSLHTVLLFIAGKTFDPATTPNGNGGVYHDVLLDKYGLELAEVIAKSLQVAALYNGARADANIATPEPRTRLQRIVASLGGHPMFANTDDASNANRDRGLMKYMARRDKNDGAGPYGRFKSAILRLQEIGKGGAATRTDSITAEKQWRAAVEEGVARTVISYFLETIDGMNKATDDDGRADAMHDYSEAIGFLYGLRALHPSERRITTAQIDEICTLALAPWGGTPTCYLFLKDPSALAKLDASTGAVSKIAAVYGLSAADVGDCKVNWVSQQSRK